MISALIKGRREEFAKDGTPQRGYDSSPIFPHLQTEFSDLFLLFVRFYVRVILLAVINNNNFFSSKNLRLIIRLDFLFFSKNGKKIFSEEVYRHYCTRKQSMSTRVAIFVATFLTRGSQQLRDSLTKPRQ